MTKDFFTVKELAERYGITRQTVRKLTNAGRLPAPLKIGHSARWRVNDITAWENSKRGEN